MMSTKDKEKKSTKRLKLKMIIILLIFTNLILVRDKEDLLRVWVKQKDL